MNLFRLHNILILTLDDGTRLSTDECTDEFVAKVLDNMNDKEALMHIFNPAYASTKSLIERINKSDILTMEGASIYIKSISQLTVPQDFAEKIVEAEEEGDDDKITAYLNFWTLLSLNPDSRVRNNLFWFLNKYGMVISKSGLFVGYRNADIYSEGKVFNQELTKFVTQKYWEKKTSSLDTPEGYIVVARDDDYFLVDEDYPLEDDMLYIGDLIDLYNTIVTADDEDSTTYTDHYTHTFKIKLGHIVSMPREKCDSVQENSCSQGLHVANLGWLTQNYFGTVGMKVLVNPADVVAVPPIDGYGKMRVCAYYPISIVNYDSDGHIIDDGIDSGFEDDFINKICYQGTINNEDHDNYKLEIPEINEIDKDNIYRKLKAIASNINRMV